jgi:sugar phosphate permease
VSQPAGDDAGSAWLKKIIGESEYPTSFRLRRWLLFSGLVLGYSFYYLCRNSLNYVLPVMVNDKALGLSITQLAAMTSIFPIAYGVCPLCLVSSCYPSLHSLRTFFSLLCKRLQYIPLCINLAMQSLGF